MIHNLDINDFLKNYWQKKPLIIRNAFPKYQCPITPEELAGLACEEFIESRIISEHKAVPKWKLENGPFPETRFTELPASHWTLLIQGLNKIFPEFDDLLHKFNFIPSWRVDDLMASYAAPEGSVGPHSDQYDVFLLQASGRRKWMISEKPVLLDNYEQGTPLKIIKNFDAESEWILEAGDMLYLPPNIAHYGIGMDDCITFSIGFRAPSHTELLSAYVDEQITDIKDSSRYRDPDLSTDLSNGEISSDAIDTIHNLLLSHFSDKAIIEDWFGRFITEYHIDDENPVENTLTTNVFIAEFETNAIIRRPASVRANYLTNQNSELSLYINGIRQIVSSDLEELAKLFCNQHLHHYANLKTMFANQQQADFFCNLYNKGYLEF